MKRLGIFIAVLAIAASCTLKETGPEFVKAPNMFGHTEGEQATKTTITVDGEGVGTILWKPADNINVFFGTTSVRYYSTNEVDATTVVFETSAMLGSTESASDNKWGLYPYDDSASSDGSSITTTIPDDQQCVPETFGNNLFPMIAHTSTNELHFKNVCGGIKFSISRDDIQSITFRGNNNEDIAGQVQLSFDGEDNPVASVVAGEKTITLTPSTGTTFASGTNYYLVMLPTVLSSGFTMTFETETEVGTFEYTAKSIVIKRSIFAKKADIDDYAAFVSKEDGDDAPDYIENGVNLGKGIAVLGDWNGDGNETTLYWAPVNCGYEEVGEVNADSDHRLGKLYQWGAGDSSLPYIYNDSPIVARELYYDTPTPSSWYDNNIVINCNTYDKWNNNQGPCPDGWRLPTRNEFKTLCAETNGSNGWTSAGSYAGQNDIYAGAEFFGANPDKSVGNGVFFPAGGLRYGSNGVSDDRGISGFYWSSTLREYQSLYRYSYNLCFNTYNLFSNNQTHDRACALSVRCVSGNEEMTDSKNDETPGDNTPIQQKPSVTIDAWADPNVPMVIAHMTITDNGGSSVTSYGIEHVSNESGNHVVNTYYGSNGTDCYANVSVMGATDITLYFRAFATNQMGTTYSSIKRIRYTASN